MIETYIIKLSIFLFGSEELEVTHEIEANMAEYRLAMLIGEES